MLRWWHHAWKTRFAIRVGIQVGIVALPLAALVLFLLSQDSSSRRADAYHDPSLHTKYDSNLGFQFGGAMIDYDGLASEVTNPKKPSEDDANDNSAAREDNSNQDKHSKMLMSSDLLKPRTNSLLFHPDDVDQVTETTP